MGIIGREIIQSRVWPNEIIEKSGNYKEVFPITVMEAVKREIGSEENLLNIIENMERIIANMQLKLPAKGAEQLVTYGGHSGEVGSIGITTHIRVDNPSNDFIPTEKAVANYLIDLGFVDDGGNVSTAQRIRWANIIGRPMVYSTTGQNMDGYMTQKAITDQFNILTNRINSIDLGSDVNELSGLISDHIQDQFNPHHVSLAQLGGVSTDNFTAHIENTNNPHQVTKEQLNLGNVDNTSDLNKPISTAVQLKFTELEESINLLFDSTEQFTSINQQLQRLNSHLIDFNNPHQVTLAQLNGVSNSSFNDHITNYANPHQVTKTQIGLGNVDNTSDLNKPISTATQSAIDDINENISDINNDISEINSILDTPFTGEQLADNCITTDKIVDKAITVNKIQDSGNNKVLISNLGEVSWDKISTNELKDNIITSNKIVNEAITVDKIANANVDSSKLASDLVLYGDPSRLTDIEDLSINNNNLVTAKWVNAQLFDTSRIIQSDINNTILSTIDSENPPIWSKITHEMLNDFIIEANNIKNLNITELKIANDSISTIKIKNNAITEDKILDNSITTNKIVDNAITSEKIFEAPESGLTLISDNTNHPVYRRLTNLDVDLGDQTIPVNKLESIDQPDRILAVISNNSDPIWTKVNSDMLRDKIVDGSKLFTSPVSNRVLAVENMYEDAFYTQVNTDMIKDDAVTSDKIADGSISYDHLSNNLLNSDWIESGNIKDESITANKLFRSEYPNRVLGVIGDPYEPPQWVQVDTNMIADEAINGDKLWMSGITENPYRVIGVTGPDVPPEYLMITGNFIVETSIPGSKLIPNTTLSGTPLIGLNPPSNSNDRTIASTAWVQSKISNFQDQVNAVISDLGGAVVSGIPTISEQDLDDDFDEVWPLSSND